MNSPIAIALLHIATLSCQSHGFTEQAQQSGIMVQLLLKLRDGYQACLLKILYGHLDPATSHSGAHLVTSAFFGGRMSVMNTFT